MTKRESTRESGAKKGHARFKKKVEETRTDAAARSDEIGEDDVEK